MFITIKIEETVHFQSIKERWPGYIWYPLLSSMVKCILKYMGDRELKNM